MSINLFDYQKEAIDHFKEKPLNLSDTGTGKSFMALGAFIASDCTRLLIICLAPKVIDFADDAKEMGLQVTPLNKGTAKNRKLLEEADMVSISFESSWRLTELLKWVDKETFIIIDESHKVGVSTSKVTKFAMKLSNRAKHTYLCTATPVSNGKLENWYPQLKMANVFKGTKKEFEELFVIKQMRQMGSARFMQITGYQNEHILQGMVNSSSVNFKRDKPYLPEDYFYTTKKPAMYNRLKKERMYKMDDGSVAKLDTASKLFNELRRVSHGVMTGISKVVSKEPFERLETILEAHNNERVVIFYNYQSECDQLEKTIKKLKRPVGFYNGKRKELKPFKGNENGVILCQYFSASTGINDLVISNVMVFFSMPLSSTNYTQAKGRTDRHGQNKTPLYYHITPNTPIEKRITDTVLAGHDFTDEMIKESIDN